MELNKNEININRYINGKLNGDELVAFEALLQQDKALHEKINFHKEVDAVLYNKMATVKTFEKEEAELKPLLKELGDEFFLSKEKVEEQVKAIYSMEEEEAFSADHQLQSKPSIIKRLLPFAALAAAAVFLLFLFIPSQKNELYAKYFEPPYNETKMSKSPNPSFFDKANKAYKGKNYKEAAVLYGQFLKEAPNNANALLYKGGSQLAIGSTDKAMLTFQQLAKANPSYKNEAQWYLALCYLKKGDKMQTQSLLKSITTADKQYYDKAQQLLQEI